MSAWIGTICGVIGALLVAMNNGYQNIGYMFFYLIEMRSILQIKVYDPLNI